MQDDEEAYWLARTSPEFQTKIREREAAQRARQLAAQAHARQTVHMKDFLSRTLGWLFGMAILCGMIYAAIKLV